MLVLLFLHVSLTIYTEMYGVGICMLVLGLKKAICLLCLQGLYPH